MQQSNDKVVLFEQTPIPKAVAQLAVPTVLSSLVMVLYNLADTFWVGMLNDPIQNAAVTLAAPVLLAFNAVNNLFGVGSSSMMSRALGRKDFDTVSRSSAFGFYCSVICGAIFSLLCTVFQQPLLVLLGADASTLEATRSYMFWTVSCGAVPAILNVVMAYLVRSEGAAMHASIGTMSGCLLNIVLDPIFILPWGLNMGAGGAGFATFLSNCVACLYFFVLRKDLCLHQPQAVLLPSGHRFRCVCGWCSGFHPEPAQRYRHDHPQQLLLRLRSGCGGCHRYLPENLHGADVRFTGHLAGRHASGQLQLFQRQRCPHEARRQLCPSGCFDGHHLGGCALLPLPRLLGILVYEE